MQSARGADQLQVFFTEADQIVYFKSLATFRGVISALGDQVYVSPNRLNQEWCGFESCGSKRWTRYLAANGAVKVLNRTMVVAPFNSCKKAELVFAVQSGCKRPAMLGPECTVGLTTTPPPPVEEVTRDFVSWFSELEEGARPQGIQLPARASEATRQVPSLSFIRCQSIEGARSGALLAHRIVFHRTQFPDERLHLRFNMGRGYLVDFLEKQVFAAPKPKRWALKPSREDEDRLRVIKPCGVAVRPVWNNGKAMREAPPWEFDSAESHNCDPDVLRATARSCEPGTAHSKNFR